MTESIKRQLILSGIIFLAAFAVSMFVLGIIGILALFGGYIVTLDPVLEKIVLMTTMTASAATLLMFCIFLKEYYKFKGVFRKEGVIDDIKKIIEKMKK